MSPSKNEGKNKEEKKEGEVTTQQDTNNEDALSIDVVMVRDVKFKR